MTATLLIRSHTVDTVKAADCSLISPLSINIVLLDNTDLWVYKDCSQIGSVEEVTVVLNPIVIAV